MDKLSLEVLSRFKGGSHRMEAGNEVTISSQCLDDSVAHPRHNVHVNDDIGAVGYLHTDLGQGRSDGSHGKGDDVHGPPPHATVVQPPHDPLEIIRGDPVVCRTGILGGTGAYIGMGFDPSHIGRV